MLQFDIFVDGEISNFVKMEGRAKAEFGASADDAVRAVTEDRVKAILGSTSREGDSAERS